MSTQTVSSGQVYSGGTVSSGNTLDVLSGGTILGASSKDNINNGGTLLDVIIGSGASASVGGPSYVSGVQVSGGEISDFTSGLPNDVTFADGGIGTIQGG